jgi:hypothetical protein
MMVERITKLERASTQDTNISSHFETLEGCRNIDMQTDTLPPAMIFALRHLIGLNSREVVQELIDRWIRWIAMDRCHLLVDTMARQLRTNSDAVLPLVEHFAKDLELTRSLCRTVIGQKIERIYLPLIRSFCPDLLDDDNGGETGDNLGQVNENESMSELAKRLLNSLASQSVKISELKTESERENWDDRMVTEKSLEILFEEERARRQLKVYRRISSQLAHMSDCRFYSSEEEYNSVKEELKKHAVPVVTFLLPKRLDLQTRWQLGLMLGYLGGREAVDPLVQALIGEDSTRAARQQMLSEYYLKPTEQQRQHAAQILQSTVADARSTLNLLRWLNGILVGFGIGLLVFAIYSATFGGNEAAAAISALGGFGAIVTVFLRDPLIRIQNAMADVVHIETAFTGFNWELHLNNAYIQSQYIANGILTDEEIVQTMQRADKAMDSTMRRIAHYTKNLPKGKSEEP